MSKYLTIVTFGATYEDGVYIDSKAQHEWEAASNYAMLMEHVEDEVERNLFFDHIPEPHKTEIKRAGEAMQGMHLRARLNSDRLNGPHIFHTDDPLSDTFLVEWAEDNVFNKRKEKRK